MALLVSYGPIAREMGRRAAQYIDFILRGANPAELPVLQPRRFEFVLNLQNAKAVGVEVPERVLALADEVIA